MRSQPPGGATDVVVEITAGMGVTAESIYSSPALLYHSAPHTWSVDMLRLADILQSCVLRHLFRQLDQVRRAVIACDRQGSYGSGNCVGICRMMVPTETNGMP